MSWVGDDRFELSASRSQTERSSTELIPVWNFLCQESESNRHSLVFNQMSWPHWLSWPNFESWAGIEPAYSVLQTDECPLFYQLVAVLGNEPSLKVYEAFVLPYTTPLYISSAQRRTRTRMPKRQLLKLMCLPVPPVGLMCSFCGPWETCTPDLIYVKDPLCYWVKSPWLAMLELNQQSTRYKRVALPLS